MLLRAGASAAKAAASHQRLPTTTTTATMAPTPTARLAAAAAQTQTARPTVATAASPGPSAAATRSASPEAAAQDKWGGGDAPSSSSSSRILPRGVAVQSHLDGGNVEVLGAALAPDGATVDVALSIVPDPFCETDGRAHFMWFNFRVAGCRGVPLRMRLVNAGEGSFPGGWRGYQAMASYDAERWFRVDGTSYDDGSGELRIEITPESDYVALAYFAPYTLDQLDRMLARTAAQPGVALRVVGETLDGHDLPVLTFGGGGDDAPEKGRGGTPSELKQAEKKKEKKQIWLVCRQHPGETQASWFAQGLADALTDRHNPKARALLRSADVHLAPNACPDGTSRGHLRTNAAGSNLNREWRHARGELPDADRAPEAHFLTRAMDASPPDLLIDVHGDEALPHVFIAGAEGVPGFYADAEGTDAGTPLGRAQGALVDALLRHVACFQTKKGYAKDAANGADMRILSNAASARYGSLAVTLEMPFKRLRLPAGALVPGGTAAVSAADEDAFEEFGPEMCARVGRDMVGALLQMVPHL
jgi:hypothetical protein